MKKPRCIPHRSRGWKSDIRVPAWSGSVESPLISCRLLTSCWILTWQRAERSKVSCDSYKGTNPIHEGSTLMTSSHHNYLLKVSPPIVITLDVEFQHEFGRGTQMLIPKQSCNFLLKIRHLKLYSVTTLKINPTCPTQGFSLLLFVCLVTFMD